MASKSLALLHIFFYLLSLDTKHLAWLTYFKTLGHKPTELAKVTKKTIQSNHYVCDVAGAINHVKEEPVQ